MTASHHPTADWLLAYASGHMSSATALATAAHLATCANCRLQLSTLNRLGGDLLDQLPPSTMAEGSLQKMLRRLDEDYSKPAATAPDLGRHFSNTVQGLPAPLAKLLPDGLPKRWTRISASLKQATLKTLADGTIVALHHIHAGGRVPQHSHDGTEITLVLNGSFSDQLGLYQAGDFMVADETVDHTPTAAENEDCLCLTVQTAPLRLTGPIGRWFNPLVRALR